MKIVMYPRSTNRPVDGARLHPHPELGPEYPVYMGWFVNGLWKGWV